MLARMAGGRKGKGELTERPGRRAVVNVFALGILLCCICLAVAAAGGRREIGAEEKKASNVSEKFELTADSGKSLKNLKDTDRYSKVTFGEEDVVRAKLPADSGYSIGGVYVIWDLVPGEWTLETGGTILKQGRFGMIHEYVDLAGKAAPGQEIVFRIPADAVLCDLIFYTEGKLPDSVQVWQPPLERADFLLFPTHGDDEHLFFGGIMPYYGAELGYKVQVAYMTNHAYTEPYRVHEQLDGLWTVGIRNYPVFGDFVDEYSKTFEDAAAMYGEDNVEAWQVEMIRRFKPYVIVGHDFEGEYGHGAHRINGTMLQFSVPAAADPSKYPDSAEKYGVWDTQKFYSHLYNRDNGVIIDWETKLLDKFGGRSALDVAKDGYKCHESQAWTSFKVKQSGYGDCRQFGLFRSTVGEDVEKNDLLEHVVFEPDPTEAPTPSPTAEPTPSPSPAATALPSGSAGQSGPETEPGDPARTAVPQETEGGQAGGATGDRPRLPTDDKTGTVSGNAGSDNSIGWIVAVLIAAIVALAVMLLYIRKRKNTGRKG